MTKPKARGLLVGVREAGGAVRATGALRWRSPLGRLGSVLLMLAAVGLAVVLPRASGALTLFPGESLVLHFSFGSPPLAPTGEVDAVVFDIALGAHSGLLGFRVELRDGNAVLGSQTTGVQELWAFTSPGSGFTLNAVLADLDPVRDGSIDGRILLTPTFDPLAAIRSAEVSFPNLSVGRGGTPPSGLVDAEPAPTVGAVLVQVPEPGLHALLALAAGLGAAAAGRRSRR